MATERFESFLRRSAPWWSEATITMKSSCLSEACGPDAPPRGMLARAARGGEGRSKRDHARVAEDQGLAGKSLHNLWQHLWSDHYACYARVRVATRSGVSLLAAADEPQ